MKQSIKPVISISLIILSLVLIFQNCSDPLGNTKDQSSFAANLPFAYDTTLDTLAYMSCAGGDTAANPQAIWSFRAGAFGANSGIRLRQSYLDMTRNFSISQRAEALGESAQNANAVLQLSIRPADRLQSILSSGGSEGELGEDYATLLGPLDDPAISGKLAAVDLANPVRLNYFSGIAGLSGRSVEGAIRFTRDEGEANSVRGFLAGTSILTATYSAAAVDNNDARGPAGIAVGSAYGRGYRVQFNYGPGETVARVISAVQELDLENGRLVSDGGAWSCPAGLQLRIARTCAECSCSSDTGNPVLLAQARRLLKVEHWYINLANRCVVQKSLSQQCYPTNSVNNYHFVSICTRGN
ncbi:MAG: hypothetical protein AB7N80_13710 [Bdellovibrionales bacterium]